MIYKIDFSSIEINSLESFKRKIRPISYLWPTFTTFLSVAFAAFLQLHGYSTCLALVLLLMTLVMLIIIFLKMANFWTSKIIIFENLNRLLLKDGHSLNSAELIQMIPSIKFLYNKELIFESQDLDENNKRNYNDFIDPKFITNYLIINPTPDDCYKEIINDLSELIKTDEEKYSVINDALQKNEMDFKAVIIQLSSLHMFNVRKIKALLINYQNIFKNYSTFLQKNNTSYVMLLFICEILNLLLLEESVEFDLLVDLFGLNDTSLTNVPNDQITKNLEKAKEKYPFLLKEKIWKNDPEYGTFMRISVVNNLTKLNFANIKFSEEFLRWYDLLKNGINIKTEIEFNLDFFHHINSRDDLSKELTFMSTEEFKANVIKLKNDKKFEEIMKLLDLFESDKNSKTLLEEWDFLKKEFKFWGKFVSEFNQTNTILDENQFLNNFFNKENFVSKSILDSLNSKAIKTKSIEFTLSFIKFTIEKHLFSYFTKFNYLNINDDDWMKINHNEEKEILINIIKFRSSFSLRKEEEYIKYLKKIYDIFYLANYKIKILLIDKAQEPNVISLDKFIEGEKLIKMKLFDIFEKYYSKNKKAIDLLSHFNRETTLDILMSDVYYYLDFEIITTLQFQIKISNQDEKFWLNWYCYGGNVDEFRNKSRYKIKGENFENLEMVKRITYTLLIDDWSHLLQNWTYFEEFQKNLLLALSKVSEKNVGKFSIQYPMFTIDNNAYTTENYWLEKYYNKTEMDKEISTKNFNSNIKFEVKDIFTEIEIPLIYFWDCYHNKWIISEITEKYIDIFDIRNKYNEFDDYVEEKLLKNHSGSGFATYVRINISELKRWKIGMEEFYEKIYEIVNDFSDDRFIHHDITPSSLHDVVDVDKIIEHPSFRELINYYPSDKEETFDDFQKSDEFEKEVIEIIERINSVEAKNDE